MEVNIGAQDKKIRVGVGIVLLILGLFVFKGSLLLILLGFVALITGLLNFCPAYKLLGMSTATGDDGLLGSVKDAASDATDKVADVAGDVKDAAGNVVDKAADAIKKD